MVLLVYSYYAGLCVFLVTDSVVWWISLVVGSGVLFVCVGFRLCLVYLVSIVLFVWCGFVCLWGGLSFNWLLVILTVCIWWMALFFGACRSYLCGVLLIVLCTRYS